MFQSKTYSHIIPPTLPEQDISDLDGLRHRATKHVHSTWYRDAKLIPQRVRALPALRDKCTSRNNSLSLTHVNKKQHKPSSASKLRIHNHTNGEIQPPARYQQDSNDNESEQYFYRKLLSEVRWQSCSTSLLGHRHILLGGLTGQAWTPQHPIESRGRDGRVFVRHTLVPKWPQVVRMIMHPSPPSDWCRLWPSHRCALFIPTNGEIEPPARSQQDSNDDESEQYFYVKLQSEVRWQSCSTS